MCIRDRGLAIARSMVQTQGGRVWARNGEPGLRVHIQLPAT